MATATSAIRTPFARLYVLGEHIMDETFQTFVLAAMMNTIPAIYPGLQTARSSSSSAEAFGQQRVVSGSTTLVYGKRAMLAATCFGRQGNSLPQTECYAP